MNTASRLRLTLLSASLMLSLAATGMSFADDRGRGHDQGRGHEQERFERGRGGREFFDDRYQHGRYYPRRGEYVQALPPGYRAFHYRDRPFFFEGGVWYEPGPRGFIVTVPPPGLVVSVLPPFATTVWLGGAPYYYADDVYYAWQPSMNAYVVVAPPAGADQPGAPPPPPEGASATSRSGEDFFIYPKNGQSQEQQSQDRYECHAWASGQTGFDPTKPGGGVPPDQRGTARDQYRRAMTACLEARGYSVQ